MSFNRLDPQARSSFEHKKFILRLSEKISKADARRIVFVEDLPKDLLGDHKSLDPLDVLDHLEMRGKTTPEELSRIFSAINRQDLVKSVAKSTKKNPLIRKVSGPSAPKLEDSLSITMKTSEVLQEQMDYLLKHALSKGNKRVEEVVIVAKTNLTDVVQRKLKYAFRLLNSHGQNQSEHCGDTSNNGSPPGPSPESSLTVKMCQPDPSSPGNQLPPWPINDGEIKRAVEKLKPLGGVTQKGAVSPRVSHRSDASAATPTWAQDTQKVGAIQASSPTNSSRDVSDDSEEDIYTQPCSPIKTTACPTQTCDVTYYNCPLRDHQQVPSLEKQSNRKALLVTGSSKTVKQSGVKSPPSTLPKPQKGKSRITAKYITERTADDSSSTDEYSSTYSCTGDSGFSDSRAFLKELPPRSPQQKPSQVEHVLDSGASYTSLITGDVHGVKYYKSLNQENRIPEAIYDTNDQPSKVNEN